jgi:prepilin-type N-terminal cleavage/methylation domain-containing protein
VRFPSDTPNVSPFSRLQPLVARVQRRLEGDEGFTLVELTIVLLIMGILLSVAVPSYLSFKDRASKTAAKTDLAQVVRSVAAYGADNYPGGANDPNVGETNGTDDSGHAGTAQSEVRPDDLDQPGRPVRDESGGLHRLRERLLSHRIGRPLDRRQARHRRRDPSRHPLPLRRLLHRRLTRNAYDAVNLTISPVIRIAALVGLVAIVALGGSVVMLGRAHKTDTPAAGERHGSATPAKRTATVHARPHVTPAAPAQAKAHAKSKAPVKTAAPATHAKATAVTPHKAAAPTKSATPHKTAAPTKTATTHKATAPKHAKKALFHGNPVYADLPAPLQWELAHHKVVVVSIYNPNADVDAISVAEAHAGATASGAGFLLVSVLNDKVAGILTGLLPGGGLLPEPGVLVYRAPGTISVRMDGFADRDSVAQAATNALAAPATTPAASAAGAPVTP